MQKELTEENVYEFIKENEFCNIWSIVDQFRAPSKSVRDILKILQKTKTNLGVISSGTRSHVYCIYRDNMPKFKKYIQYQIYDYIKKNPHCKAKDIALALGSNNRAVGRELRAILVCQSEINRALCAADDGNFISYQYYI